MVEPEELFVMNMLRRMLMQITIKWWPFCCRTEQIPAIFCWCLLENVMDAKTFIKSSLSKSSWGEKKERTKTGLIRSESSPQVDEAWYDSGVFVHNSIK